MLLDSSVDKAVLVADIPLTRAIGAVAAKFDRIGGIPGTVTGEADVYYHGVNWEDNFGIVIGS